MHDATEMTDGSPIDEASEMMRLWLAENELVWMNLLGYDSDLSANETTEIR